jgi:HAD superfamily phosphoserine phosphatase-like hydrolase
VRAAFFDLDKTVIAKASIAAFGRPFRRGGLINRRVVLRAVMGQLIFLQFGQIVRQTLLETIEPLIYNEALELMEAHRLAGDRVYLVSAAPEEIVLPLTELLGVDGAISSIGEVDENGRYTGRMAFYAYGSGKADAIRALAERNGIDLAESSAYSDSATDLPMLEAVGHPVAVNADRPLARIARERDWEVRQFTKPVRLRDRVTVRTPVVTTGLAVAAGAALLLWRGRRGRALPVHAVA